MRRVSVIIPARNDSNDLGSAVQSVLAQTGIEISVIVLAVGPSGDDTMAVAQDLALQHSSVEVVESPEGTTPAGLNRAIDSVAGAVVARVDARSVLPGGYLANAAETLDQTGAANVGARQLVVGHTGTERAIAAAMAHRLGSGSAQYRHGGVPRPVDTAYLGVFRRAALLEVGGYDERFVRNQDAELNVRLAKIGGGVWLDPRLVVQYRPRPSLAKLGRQYYDYGYWRRKTAQKHRGSLAPRQRVAAAIPVVLVTAVAAAAVSWWALTIPLAYLALVGSAAAITTELSVAERAKMALALVTMHMCWGVGFLRSGFNRLPDGEGVTGSGKPA